MGKLVLCEKELLANYFKRSGESRCLASRLQLAVITDAQSHVGAVCIDPGSANTLIYRAPYTISLTQTTPFQWQPTGFFFNCNIPSETPWGEEKCQIVSNWIFESVFRHVDNNYIQLRVELPVFIIKTLQYSVPFIIFNRYTSLTIILRAFIFIIRVKNRGKALKMGNQVLWMNFQRQNCISCRKKTRKRKHRYL